MKKRTYRATNVKHANWEKIAGLAAGQRVVLGVDVGKDDFFAVLMKTDRSVIETIKWVHPRQTVELVGHLRQHPGPFGLCSVTAVPVLAAELFELVVQVSHGVVAVGSVFVTTQRP